MYSQLCILEISDRQLTSQMKAGDTPPLFTLEDIFERACEHFTSKLKEESPGNTDSTSSGTWEDILAFGETQIVRDAAARICDTQEVTPDLSVYRLSRSKVLAELQKKVDSLANSSEQFEAAPETLGQKYSRMIDRDDKASEEEKLAGRRAVVCDTLATWLSEDWVAALKSNVGLASS